jgi:hypothetical protein
MQMTMRKAITVARMAIVAAAFSLWPPPHPSYGPRYSHG